MEQGVKNRLKMMMFKPVKVLRKRWWLCYIDMLIWLAWIYAIYLYIKMLIEGVRT